MNVAIIRQSHDTDTEQHTSQLSYLSSIIVNQLDPILLEVEASISFTGSNPVSSKCSHGTMCCPCTPNPQTFFISHQCHFPVQLQTILRSEDQSSILVRHVVEQFFVAIL